MTTDWITGFLMLAIPALTMGGLIVLIAVVDALMRRKEYRDGGGTGPT